MSTERGFDAADSQDGHKEFPHTLASSKIKAFAMRRGQWHEFHSLFPTSRPRIFSLGFYTRKIRLRRSKRIVTPHSLNAKITWLKHCRNLGHLKLIAARGQL